MCTARAAVLTPSQSLTRFQHKHTRLLFLARDVHTIAQYTAARLLPVVCILLRSLCAHVVFRFACSPFPEQKKSSPSEASNNTNT